MPETVTDGLHLLAQVFEAVGALALIIGFVIATARCLLQLGSSRAAQAIESYRQAIGRAILIGLEILLAATIIKTVVVDPTLRSIGLLAMMIAIRTVLGWSTCLELDGRWPWQKRA